MQLYIMLKILSYNWRIKNLVVTKKIFQIILFNDIIKYFENFIFCKIIWNLIGWNNMTTDKSKRLKLVFYICINVWTYVIHLLNFIFYVCYCKFYVWMRKRTLFPMTKQEQMYPIISALSAALENCIVSIILRTFFFVPPRDIKI